MIISIFEVLALFAGTFVVAAMTLSSAEILGWFRPKWDTLLGRASLVFMNLSVVSCIIALYCELELGLRYLW